MVACLLRNSIVVAAVAVDDDVVVDDNDGDGSVLVVYHRIGFTVRDYFYHFLLFNFALFKRIPFHLSTSCM